MQRKLRPSIKISLRKLRWRLRQAEEDEVDEALLGLGTEKEASSASNLRTNVQLT
jgi:hypothetical protein